MPSSSILREDAVLRRLPYGDMSSMIQKRFLAPLAAGMEMVFPMDAREKSVKSGPMKWSSESINKNTLELEWAQRIYTNHDREQIYNLLPLSDMSPYYDLTEHRDAHCVSYNKYMFVCGVY